MWSCLLQPQFMWVKPTWLLQVLSGIDLEFLTLVSPAFLVFSRERGGEEGSTKTVLQKICLSTCLPKLQEFWSMCIYFCMWAS